jgi:hypothetical protein
MGIAAWFEARSAECRPLDAGAGKAPRAVTAQRGTESAMT